MLPVRADSEADFPFQYPVSTKSFQFRDIQENAF